MSTPLLTAYPSLTALSESDLKDLLADEALTQAVLYGTEAVRGVLEVQEGLSRENERVAASNLALQSDLIALRGSTTSAYTTARHLQGRWKEVEGRQAGVYAKYRPSFLHLRLRHAMQDQDALTEQMASEFVEAGPSAAGGAGGGGGGYGAVGSGQNSRVDSPAFGVGAGGSGSGSGSAAEGRLSLDEFVRTFKAARKVYHKRAIWYERWTRGEVAWRED